MKAMFGFPKNRCNFSPCYDEEMLLAGTPKHESKGSSTIPVFEEQCHGGSKVPLLWYLLMKLFKFSS